jgi:hypothetical protein
MASNIKPGRGSERVKAWVYAILTPAIDALRSETALLKTGNLSWRAYNRRCEYIRPVSELIDPGHQPILDDLLSEDPTLGARFNEHDLALERLEEAAAQFIHSLVQSPPFQKLVADCLTNYESMRASNPLLPELGDAKRIPVYVAEFIVNNTGPLPQHYTMHAFWESFRSEFTKFKEQASFRATVEAATSLLHLSERLIVALHAIRLNMVREYDIPAAPIEIPRGNSENSATRFR